MKNNCIQKVCNPILLLALACLLVLCGNFPAAAANKLPGQGVTVKPGRATWSTGFFLEALYSRALEDLGYTVEEPKKLSNPIFYESLANGDLDFWANG